MIDARGNEKEEGMNYRSFIIVYYEGSIEEDSSDRSKIEEKGCCTRSPGNFRRDEGGWREDGTVKRDAMIRRVRRKLSTRSNLQRGRREKESEEAGRATFRMTRLLGVAEIIDEPVTRTGATRGLNNVFQPLKSS